MLVPSGFGFVFVPFSLLSLDVSNNQLDGLFEALFSFYCFFSLVKKIIFVYLPLEMVMALVDCCFWNGLWVSFWSISLSFFTIQQSSRLACLASTSFWLCLLSFWQLIPTPFHLWWFIVGFLSFEIVSSILSHFCWSPCSSC